MRQKIPKNKLNTEEEENQTTELKNKTWINQEWKRSYNGYHRNTKNHETIIHQQIEQPRRNG